MTIDEELSLLEESVRRLKIEYDVYFGGGAKKPPADTEWRVQNLIRKYSDGHRMNFAQRFRYNTIAQKYALYNGLWQQKLKIKEEGYRRPQDAALGIQGVRIAEDAAAGKEKAAASFKARIANVDAEHEEVERLYNSMVAAQSRSGKAPAGDLNSFKAFLKRKTEQLRKEKGCSAVEYSLDVSNGQVKLKAKAF
jgi:hypothetical protein